MKKGDTVPVNINGAVVGHAVVEHVGDTQVTLMIPATKVIMGLRVELESTPPAPAAEPQTEVIIEGVDRAGTISGEASTPTPPAPEPAPAPVGESTPPAAQPVDNPAVTVEVPGTVEEGGAANPPADPPA